MRESGMYAKFSNETEVKRLQEDVYKIREQTSVSPVDGTSFRVHLPSMDDFTLPPNAHWDSIEESLDKTGRLHLYSGRFLTLVPREHLYFEDWVASFFEWIHNTEHAYLKEKYVSWDHATAWRIEASWITLARTTSSRASEAISMSLRADLTWAINPSHIRDNNHGLFLVSSLLFSIPHLDPHFLDLTEPMHETIRLRLQSILGRVYTAEGWNAENSPLYDRVWINLLRDILAGHEDALNRLGLTDFLKLLISKASVVSRAQLYPDSRYVPRGDTHSRHTGLEPLTGTHFSIEAGIWTYHHGGLYLMATAGHMMSTHKHVDDTQVIAHWRGVDFFIDGGFYSFTFDDPRVLALRSNFGHSALDLDPPETVTPHMAYIFNTAPIISTMDAASESSVTMKKSFRDHLLERTISVSASSCRLDYHDRLKRDTSVSDSSHNEQRMVSRFLIPKDLDVLVRRGRAEIWNPSARAILSLETPGEISLTQAEHVFPYRGWYPTAYKEMHEGCVLEIRPQTTGESELKYKVEFSSKETDSD
ncbi:heparinase II/III family protein [Micrococcus luteus]|uniref:heparinase II/III family protein n=1 Tax=Micrococcus luteus TaxID=1270 RepID=UPI001E5A11A7|nr:heparinase II/III family protein [Micrococcus luteus]MCD0182907.1 heparinase II/III family protein [Micrococcus luteus]